MSAISVLLIPTFSIILVFSNYIFRWATIPDVHFIIKAKKSCTTFIYLSTLRA